MEDISISNRGSMPSASQQTSITTTSQISKAVRPSFERTAQFLISNCLKIFHTKDTFPSVEEFSASSDDISRALVGLRVPLNVWDSLSKQILTILRHIESAQGLSTSEIDSRIGNEEVVLRDLRSLQDVLTDRRNISIASCESIRTKIAEVDTQVKQMDEERSRLLSEKCLMISSLQEEVSLKNIEDAHGSNSELIEKCEAELNSLIEHRRLTSSIEDQKLALQEIIKDF